MATCAISATEANVIPATSKGRDDSQINLVKRAQSGDEHAFATLFQQHKNRVYSVCLLMTKDDLLDPRQRFRSHVDARAEAAAVAEVEIDDQRMVGHRKRHSQSPVAYRATNATQIHKKVADARCRSPARRPHPRRRGFCRRAEKALD